jgi:hypothetical protein
MRLSPVSPWFGAVSTRVARVWFVCGLMRFCFCCSIPFATFNIHHLHSPASTAFLQHPPAFSIIHFLGLHCALSRPQTNQQARHIQLHDYEITTSNNHF